MFDRKAYMKEYLKIYRAKPENKVKAKSNHKRWSIENETHLKSYKHKWWFDNVDENRMKKRTHYWENWKRIRATQRKWTHSTEGKAYKKKYDKDNPEVKLRSQKKRFKILGLTLFDLMAWTKVIRKGKNCSYCDSDKDLHSHHLIPKSKQPGLALNENNGIPLCKPCHKEHHMLNGVN